MLEREPEDNPRRLCYGCGDRNPEGLHIDFQVDGRLVTGRFTARKAHQGYPGVAHGGIAAAVLDEAMGWAMYAAGAWAMTARMEVRYRKPLPLGRELTVTAEVVRERGRRLEAQAQVRTARGEVLAEAAGLFLRLPPSRAAEMQAFYPSAGSGQAPSAGSGQAVGRAPDPARD